MEKKVLRLTESELCQLVKESAQKVLSELDWRTYADAKKKARALADSSNIGKYEKKRRENQAKSFAQAAYDTSNKQYGIDKIEKKRQDFEKENPGKEYSPSNGELKRMQKQADDVHNFYTNKQEYKNGKWQDKTNESIDKQINEGEEFKNNQNYSHFAVSKKSGKIINGWDYHDYDPSELKQFKKDYFDVDLIDYGFNPKDFRILSYKYLVRNGIDPDNNANWANNDEANSEWVG